MVNISLTLYTNGLFDSVLKSSFQMVLLSVINSATNISRLGTFNFAVLSRNRISFLYHTTECSNFKIKLDDHSQD
jgi:hypothetical protein